MIQVKSDRLRLVALSPGELEALVRGWPDVEAALGVTASDVRIPEEFREAMPQAFAMCLEHSKDHPEHHLWYTVWPIILTDENRVIGTTGFGGPPNERGEVFTGYWIDERYRNRGYVTEAVQAIAKWAFENPEVKAVTANTPECNIASQRVLMKAGFHRRGEFEGHPFWVLPR